MCYRCPPGSSSEHGDLCAASQARREDRSCSDRERQHQHWRKRCPALSSQWVLLPFPHCVYLFFQTFLFTLTLSAVSFTGIDLIAAFYGCLYAGCVPVNVRPPHPQNLAATLPTVRMIIDVCLSTLLQMHTHYFGLTDFVFQVSKAACILTTQHLMRILRSKEAAASVNIKTWPTIIDTGMCLHITNKLFLKKQGDEIIFRFVIIGLCSYKTLSVPVHRRPSSPSASTDLQAAHSGDDCLSGLQRVHHRHAHRGKGETRWQSIELLLCLLPTVSHVLFLFSFILCV